MNERRPLSSPSIRLADERRGLARYPFELDAVCRRTGGSTRDAEPGKVCNISAHGLGVTLTRRFTEGSELSLDLHDTPQSVAGTLHVRVMNVRETGPGSWLHGCSFVSHRAGVDMQAAFRAKLGRPPGRERRTLLRYPFVMPATGRALTAAIKERWAGTTHDISAAGMRIASASAVNVGTLLTVKVQADAAAGARTLMARVMHASAAASGGWDLGCMFPTRLAPHELHALLKEAWTRSRQKSKGPPDPAAALKLALADQIERNHLADAQRTVTELLRLRPDDPDGMAAWEFLESMLQPTVPAGELCCLKGHKACVNAVAFYANGRCALSGGGVDNEMQRDIDHSIRFWDLTAGFEVHSFAGHRSPVCAIAVPVRSTRALTASRCGMLLLWDLERRTVIRQFDMHGRGTNCVGISATGKWALTGCDDAMLRLWDNDRGRCLRRFSGHAGAITACAFVGDEHTAVSAGMDRTVRIWTPQRQMVLSGHTKGVLCVAVSPDGRQVASGSADNTVRIWDVASHAEVCRLEGHENVINGIAFAPDGVRLASASADNTVRIWDTRKGIELGCFNGHTGSVKSVAFSPDGERLLSAASDQTVRLWDVAAEPA